MASVIRVGQSKFVTVPIDEDSHERILNCIQTLSSLEERPVVHEIFLSDTKAAYSKMVAAQEVGVLLFLLFVVLIVFSEKSGGEERVGSYEGACDPSRRCPFVQTVLEKSCRRRN